MAEHQEHYDEFRLVVAKHIKELRDERHPAQSTSWYFLKYLRRVHKKTVVSSSAREVDNTIRAMVRFYVDAIDEGSNLEGRFNDVLKFHRRSLRMGRHD